MEQASSALGRLLQEVSWEGNARHYREGGRGFENVLTAEVFQALDFLPRTAFLGKVVDSASGATPARSVLASQVEQAAIGLLPGDVFLTGEPGRAAVSVQPDAIIEAPGVYCMVEAKRIRRGSFQPDQLAREYVAVVQEAGERQPLLLLVLPTAPPVPIRAHGRMPVHEAIAGWIDAAVECSDLELSSDELLARIDDVVAFTTWGDVSRCVSGGVAAFADADPTVLGSIERMAHAVQSAIEWHS